MSTRVKHDLVILGGGPAGLSAAIYATRAGLDALTIEQGAFGGQIASTDTVDNYPGLPGIGGGALGTSLHDHAESLGAAFAADTITSIERTGQGGFLLAGYEAGYEARALIYAAGASPRAAGFAGEERFLGRGVSYCATCDGMFYRNKDVFVVGGGNTACEEAIYLASLGARVTMVVRKDHLRAVRMLAERVERDERITVRYLTSIAAIEGETLPELLVLRDNASGQETSARRDPGGFGIFVAVGHVPVTGLVASLVELAADGSAVCAPDLATKTPGLFCAGDVRQTPLRQALTAAADGAVAATSAARYLEGLSV